MEVTVDRNGPSVEWWGGSIWNRYRRKWKERQWRCPAWVTPKLGETVHACVLIGTQVKKDRSMGRYSGRRETVCGIEIGRSQLIKSTIKALYKAK